MYRPSRIVVISLLGCALAACGNTASPTAGLSGGNATGVATAGTLIATSAATTAVSTTTAAAPLVATSMASAATSPSVGSSSVGQDGVQETLHVVVTGGPHAGTYDKSGTDGGCSTGLAGGDSWGNQYSNAAEKTGFSSLQLIVPSTKEAAGSTGKFLTTFTFGDLSAASSTSYNVDGRDGEAPKGKGTVKVDDKGNMAVVIIHAEPQPDVKIDATITCNQVFRNKSDEPTKASDTSATDQPEATDEPTATATP